jgi:hypothetical protein
MKRSQEDFTRFAQEPSFAPEGLTNPQAPPNAYGPERAGKRRVIGVGSLRGWFLCATAAAGVGGMWLGGVVPAREQVRAAQDALAHALRVNAQLEAQLLAPNTGGAQPSSGALGAESPAYDGEGVGQAIETALQDLIDQAVVTVRQQEQTVLVTVAAGPGQMEHFGTVLGIMAHHEATDAARLHVVIGRPLSRGPLSQTNRWARYGALLDACTASLGAPNEPCPAWDVSVVQAEKDPGTIILRLEPAQ